MEELVIKIYCFGDLIILFQFAPSWRSHFPICELSFVKSVRICQIQYHPWAHLGNPNLILGQWTTMDRCDKRVLPKKKVGICPNTAQFYFPKARSTIKSNQRSANIMFHTHWFCACHMVGPLLRSVYNISIFCFFIMIAVAKTRYQIVLISW